MTLEAAVSVLKRAVELDEEKSFSEALVCYQEGMSLLMSEIKETKDEALRKRYRDQMNSYLERATKLKEFVQEKKKTGEYHEQIKIKSGEVGFGYARIFGPYVDKSVVEVVVEDPYIRSVHQIYNFLRLCELFVLKGSVRVIKLLTGQEENPENRKQQFDRLCELENNLKKYNVNLQVTYSKTLHDREIRFNNGWVIKIGRGLDYFKPPNGKFCIGFCDYNLRECHQTDVDVYFKKK